MDGWWTEIEAEIRAIAQRHPALTLQELAGHLGVSQRGTASILRVLMIDQPGDAAVVPDGTPSSARSGASGVGEHPAPPFA